MKDQLQSLIIVMVIIGFPVMIMAGDYGNHLELDKKDSPKQKIVHSIEDDVAWMADKLNNYWEYYFVKNHKLKHSSDYYEIRATMRLLFSMELLMELRGKCIHLNRSQSTLAACILCP